MLLSESKRTTAAETEAMVVVVAGTGEARAGAEAAVVDEAATGIGAGVGAVIETAANGGVATGIGDGAGLEAVVVVILCKTSCGKIEAKTCAPEKSVCKTNRNGGDRSGVKKII